MSSTGRESEIRHEGKHERDEAAAGGLVVTVTDAQGREVWTGVSDDAVDAVSALRDALDYLTDESGEFRQ